MKSILILFIPFLMGNQVMAQHDLFYSNDEDGYSFNYPETWKRSDDFSGKLSLVALAPEETGAEDGVREQLSVAILDLAGKSANIFYSQFKTSHEEKHRSWKFVEDGELMSRETKTNYFSCYYSDVKSGKTKGEMVFIFTNKDKAYLLTCTTSFDEMERYKPIFIKMAQSFSFVLAPKE